MMCHLIYDSQEGGFIEKVTFEHKDWFTLQLSHCINVSSLQCVGLSHTKISYLRVSFHFGMVFWFKNEQVHNFQPIMAFI